MSQQLFGKFIYITEYVLPIILLSKNKSEETLYMCIEYNNHYFVQFLFWGIS